MTEPVVRPAIPKALIAAALGGLGLRLVGLTNPFLDALAERQAQVAIVARHLAHDFAWWCPKLDIFGPPRGCTILEFPALPLLVAPWWRWFGEQAWIARLLVVVFGVATIVWTYRLARRFVRVEFAWVAAALVAVSPLHIYMSRSFQPDALMLLFMVGAVERWFAWCEQRKTRDFVLSGSLGALALLQKPTAIVFLAAVAVHQMRVSSNERTRTRHLFAYALTVLLPVILWFAWSEAENASNTANSGSYSSWLLVLRRGVLESTLLGGAFWKSLTVSSTALITPVGIFGVLIAAGFSRSRAELLPIWGWLLAAIAAALAMPGLYETHPYYLLSLLPPAAVLTAFAADSISRGWHVLRSKRGRLLVLSGAFACVVAYAVTWQAFYRYMYDVRTRMPWTAEAAEVVKSLTHIGEPFVLLQPAALPTVVTYLANRPSWSFRRESQMTLDTLEAWRRDGAAVLLALDTRYGSGVEQLKASALGSAVTARFELVRRHEHFLVYDLRHRITP